MLFRSVGARALRAVTEEVMLDLMFELPEQEEKGAAYRITKDFVTDASRRSLFAARQQRKKESA